MSEVSACRPDLPTYYSFHSLPFVKTNISLTSFFLPTDNHLLHKRREQRRVKLQALLLTGQQAQEQCYPFRPVFPVIELT